MRVSSLKERDRLLASRRSDIDAIFCACRLCSRWLGCLAQYIYAEAHDGESDIKLLNDSDGKKVHAIEDQMEQRNGLQLYCYERSRDELRSWCEPPLPVTPELHLEYDSSELTLILFRHPWYRCACHCLDASNIHERPPSVYCYQHPHTSWDNSPHLVLASSPILLIKVAVVQLGILHCIESVKEDR